MKPTQSRPPGELPMSTATIALLPDRGVVSVTGEDAAGFLDNLITNDMSLLGGERAIHAGLLSPQGKILFAFFVVSAPDGFLLETARAQAPDLVKRLGLYKLRANVSLNDLSGSRVVVAAWGGPLPRPPLSLVYADPRHSGLGSRLIMAPEMAAKLDAEDAGAEAYHTHRITLGVPEAGRDFVLGDTFPHEADFDRQAGVSFTKGCFVGQEVVARMQHKTVVRKRVVAIAADAALTPGADIRVGEAVIGTVGSVARSNVAGSHALALLRLDRAAEAQIKGQALTAGTATITVDAAALAAYEAAVARSRA